LADSSQKFDIALATMTERKAAAEINFFRVQAIRNHSAQEIFGANLREVLIKVNDYGLFDPQYAQGFYLLIERLQEGWRGFGMEQSARMRVECDHGGHGARRPGPLNNRFHDQLMPQVQTVEYPQSQHCGSRDFGVVGAVKEAHQSQRYVSIRMQENIFHFSFVISHFPFAGQR
jgi:hypothetical protein